ncbi:MAG: hypothetical protein D6814_09620 [Calditrichaeota bacterium]|nr:MAG: hypothetical protein D6814_09620 [Calditrichota bacterium]
MESGDSLVNLIFANKQTFALILTAGFGLLIGKLLRSVVKIVAYFAAVIALIMMALQYLGIIYITVNFNFLSEIMQWIYLQAKSLGFAEHLFFWVPMVYGLKRKRVLGIL